MILREDLSEDKKDELQFFCLDGDGFWYCLNEGYIDIDEVVEEDRIDEIKNALDVLLSFEEECLGNNY